MLLGCTRSWLWLGVKKTKAEKVLLKAESAGYWKTTVFCHCMDLYKCQKKVTEPGKALSIRQDLNIDGVQRGSLCISVRSVWRKHPEEDAGEGAVVPAGRGYGSSVPRGWSELGSVSDVLLGVGGIGKEFWIDGLHYLDNTRRSNSDDCEKNQEPFSCFYPL